MATACDALREWMKKSPSSSHTQEAQQVLQAADPKILVLRDEAAWSSAKVDACRTPTTGDACFGVDGYISNFPNGAHLKEAQELTQKSANKVAALRKAEEQRQAQQQKKQELEDCKKDCKENRCAAYVLSAKYDVCMQRCVKNACGD